MHNRDLKEDNIFESKVMDATPRGIKHISASAAFNVKFGNFDFEP
jgi:hypothetical protein